MKDDEAKRFGNFLKDYIADEKKQQDYFNSQNENSASNNANSTSGYENARVKFVNVSSKYSIQDLFDLKSENVGTGNKFYENNFSTEKDWKENLPHFKSSNENKKNTIKKFFPSFLENDLKKLGLTTNSTFEECKSAYKNLIKKYHPDMYINHPNDYEKATKITASVTESFNRIQEWYKKTYS